MNLVEEIKDSFRQGTSLTRLIYINLGVFLSVKIVYIFLFLFNAEGAASGLVTWLAVPASLNELIRNFWTPLTYMFYHEGFIHILFNLLWLYWFGKIFLEYFDQKKLVSVYLMGGLSGAFLYIFSFNIFPVFAGLINQSVALGASAAVMAIVVATAVYVPNYVVRLLLIGPVQIKYVALVVFLFTSVLDFSSNTGGKIAHIGGAFLGYIYTLQYKRGKDMGRGFNRTMDGFFNLFKRRSKLKVTHKKPPENDLDYNKMKAGEQQEINRILDKISKGGYDSLTKAEKDTLFKMSDKK